MLLDSSESNFLGTQLIVGISIPATHYLLLPDMLFSLLIYLKLTLHINLTTRFCLLFSEP